MKRYVSVFLFVKTNTRCVAVFCARWKNYVAGPTERHMALTRCTCGLQHASGKFISRKNEKLLDDQQIPLSMRGMPFPALYGLKGSTSPE